MSAFCTVQDVADLLQLELAEDNASVSTCPSIGIRSPMEPPGSRCRLIATSPNIRSRSINRVRQPELARWVERLVATVVLPTPPLAEKTVTTLPLLVGASLGPLRCELRARLLAIASARAVWSPVWTTSRIPLRRASDSEVTSRRCRIRMTPSSGRNRRSRWAS